MTPARLTTLLVALAVAAVAAPAASARHGAEWPHSDPTTCPDYTTESHYHSNDDAVVAAVVLAAEGVYEVFDRTDNTAGKGVAAGVQAAAEVAALAVTGVNRVAQACYETRHFDLQDELMRMTMQADLAVTTTPDVSFLMPEELPDGHVPPVRKERAGFIRRERSNPQNDVAAEDLLSIENTVRWTIDGMKETGQCTCSLAESSYSQAVGAMESGQYKNAYRLFRQAYVYAFGN